MRVVTVLLLLFAISGFIQSAKPPGNRTPPPPPGQQPPPPPPAQGQQPPPPQSSDAPTTDTSQALAFLIGAHNAGIQLCINTLNFGQVITGNNNILNIGTGAQRTAASASAPALMQNTQSSGPSVGSSSGASSQASTGVKSNAQTGNAGTPLLKTCEKDSKSINEPTVGGPSTDNDLKTALGARSDESIRQEPRQVASTTTAILLTPPHDRAAAGRSYTNVTSSTEHGSVQHEEYNRSSIMDDSRGSTLFNANFDEDIETTTSSNEARNRSPLNDDMGTLTRERLPMPRRPSNDSLLSTTHTYPQAKARTTCDTTMRDATTRKFPTITIEGRAEGPHFVTILSISPVFWRDGFFCFELTVFNSHTSAIYVSIAVNKSKRGTTLSTNLLKPRCVSRLVICVERRSNKGKRSGVETLRALEWPTVEDPNLLPGAAFRKKKCQRHSLKYRF